MFVFTTNVYVYCGKYSLLIRRSATDDTLPLFWETAGGHTDVVCPLRNMSLLKKEAARELREETGISVNPRALEFLGAREHHATFKVQFEKCPSVRLSFEHDKFVWINPKNRSQIPVNTRWQVLDYFRKGSL